MRTLEGRHRLVPARSIARVEVQAPGHRFRAEGPGLEGEAEVEGDRLVSARVRFPLARLRAGDPLGQRELGRFLGLDAQPWAEGHLLAPVTLSLAADGAVRGAGQVRVDVRPGPASRSPLMLQLEGRLPQLRVTLGASFSALGFEAPRLLFLKVADPLTLTLELEVEAAGAASSAPGPHGGGSA